MTKACIFSRFNENINWTEQITHLFNEIIIYNKGEKNIDCSFCKIVEHENVGREGQTYLQYIINNYNSLPDFLLFSQAHPFDRGWSNSTNLFIDTINNVINELPELRLLGLINNETQDYCAPHPHHHNNELKYKEEYETLFKQQYPFHLIYSSGATIWVSKKNILHRSKDFYIHLNNKMNKEVHPAFGWILERFWHTIFSTDIESYI